MRAVSGQPSAESQKGIKPTLVEQAYFLACSCKPQEDMQVVLPNTASFRKHAIVDSIHELSSNVIRLRLKQPEDYDYCAGQFLTLFHPEGFGRSYSLASVPAVDNVLEFHIRHYPEGKLSHWVAEDLRAGDEIEISEAIGECVYLRGAPEQPLLLVATGTGLAPLYGIIKQALHEEHSGEIKLYHGSHSVDGLYLVDELRLLAEKHRQFTYVPCVSGEDPGAGYMKGRANDIALEQNRQLKNWRVYLCGVPNMVDAARRQAFMAGASMMAIHSDSFIHGQ
jgi:NAD(P)H-flavin reductase